MFILSLCCGCGYRLAAQNELPSSIEVPYVKGDSEGELTDEIVRQLTSTGRFRCVQRKGKIKLLVKVINDGKERIGFRYARDDNTGKLKHNLFPTEGRRNMSIEITMIDAFDEKILMGPVTISANSEYDYIDVGSVRDLTFINSKGQRETVLSFSQGQLDSSEGAQDATLEPLYRHLAKKAVEIILMQLPLEPNNKNG